MSFFLRSSLPFPRDVLDLLSEFIRNNDTGRKFYNWEGVAGRGRVGE
jgi:hypothetical protein